LTTKNDLKQLRMGATNSVFRFEVLRAYGSALELESLRAYLAGEPKIRLNQTGWNDFVRSRVDAGVIWNKAHVCRSPLTDYERWSFEWPCADTEEAGQRLYILDLAEVAESPALPEYDYWMYDESIVIRMRYDEEGRYQGNERLPDAEVAAHVAYRDAAIAAATRYPDYWAAHSRF
jgi:hypothetical protein